eukprot:CFRG6829T1
MALRLRQTNLYVVAAVVVSLAVLIVSFFFKSTLLKHLKEFAEFIRNCGFLGIFLSWALIVLTSIPPMFGYSWIVVICGYVYGYDGFLIAYVGALCGAFVAFSGGRWLFKEQVERWMIGSSKLTAIAATISEADFKLLVLIRVAPYPFTVLNVLFAVTDIPLGRFMWATAISLFKLVIHISIGISLSSLDTKERSTSPGEFALLIFGAGLTIYLTYYAYTISQSAIQQHTPESRVWFTNEVDDADVNHSHEEESELVAISMSSRDNEREHRNFDEL